MKYLLSKQMVNTIYTTFIRPILEYDSEVSDECWEVNINRLEKVQLEAAWLFGGLSIYVKQNIIR